MADYIAGHQAQEPDPDFLRPRKRQHATAHLECWNDRGLQWQEDILQNVWHDEGEQYILSACFATNYTDYGAARGTLYIGLDCRTVLAEGDTLASLLLEVASASNYQRLPLVTSGSGAAGQDFVLSQPSAAWQFATKSVAFSASTSSWGKIYTVFLTDHPTATATGTNQHLLCSLATSTPRTVNSGESLNTWMSLGISEP